MAGYLAKTRGDDFTFLTLAAIAVGLVFFWALMPETRDSAAVATPAAKVG